MGLRVVRTDGQDRDFGRLIVLLDEDLYVRHGDLQKQYQTHNRVASTSDVVLIYEDGVPVACGAFKEHDRESIELKRIFVVKEARRRGLARLILSELEALGRERGYRYAVLETGLRQLEAISLYQSAGYVEIPNYEPYAGNANSVCMKKAL